MQRIDELESLRGILALWVVAVHALLATDVAPEALGIWSPLLTEAVRVEVFCVMSGFVIFMSLDRRREGYAVFVARRFLRLFPAYLVVLLASIALLDVFAEALRSAPFQGARNAARLDIIAASQRHFWPHLAAHLTMLHGVVPSGWLPHTAYAFVGQAWNVSLEWQFYLVAPLVFRALAGRLALVWTAVIVACAMLVVGWPNPASLPRYVTYFGVGVFAFHVWRPLQAIRRPGLLMPGGTLVVGMATRDLALTIFTFTFLTAAAARIGSGPEQRVSRVLRLPVLRYLGRISYSIYLVHMIPLYLCMHVMRRWDHGAAAYFVVLFSATALLTVATSHVLYELVEKPSVELGRRLGGIVASPTAAAP